MTALVVVLAGLGAVTCVAQARTVARVDLAEGAQRERPEPSAVGVWWRMTLDDLGVEVDPDRAGRVVAGALVVLAVLAGWRGGPVGAVVAVGVAVLAGGVVRRAGHGRGARQADARLPELVEHVGRALRAGHDLRGAVLAAGTVVGGTHGDALGAVVSQVDGGAGWDDALATWADTHPRRPVELVGGALAMCAAAGGRVTVALDGVADTLRARAAVADEARALASQAQASAVVLIALPAVVAVGGAVVDPTVADVLVGTPWGIGCIALAALLDGTGALWMHRIVAGARS